MVMIMDERTKRKFRQVQIHLQEMGKFNPALRSIKSAKRIRKDNKIRSRNERGISNRD